MKTAFTKLIVLLVLPVLVGLFIFTQFIPSHKAPVESRVEHPETPPKYKGLTNPLQNPSQDRVKRFIAERNVTDLEEAKKLLVNQYLEEGKSLYQKNCSPCHGVKADGEGLMARSLRLKPANFTDQKKALTDDYLFWRIKEGGVALPAHSTPWDSAMPSWGNDLTEEEIWKIILALQDMAGAKTGTTTKLEYDQDELKKRKAAYPLNQHMRTAGAEVYKKRCAFCHGEKGGGDGPIADYLNPRPRDLTRNFFKFRSTLTEEYPTDEDLFRTISQGIPGTSMPAWNEGRFKLTEEELWAVVYHIKTFNSDFSDPSLDPYKSTFKIGTGPGESKYLNRGATLFKSEAGCAKCHGASGRGDGIDAAGQKDNAGFPILPADLTKEWRYKNWGDSPREVFRSISTGLNGTPMPSYQAAVAEEDRWALAYFVHSLVKQENVDFDAVIVSKYIKSDMPTDPNDPRWEKAPRRSIPLSGQLITKPRLLNHSIDLITVRSLFNDHQIGFLLIWNDRFKNIGHGDSLDLTEEQLNDTYVKVDYEGLGQRNYRDAVALQFPPGHSEGSQRPYFFLGQTGASVNLWWWKADWQQEPDRHQGTGVEEINAEGPQKPYRPQLPEDQSTKSYAAYDNGQWKVILVRSLRTGDEKNDVQFTPGARQPIAFQAWDGANNETDLQRSTSSWFYLQLEPPVPLRAYVLPIVGALLAAGVGQLILHKGKRQQ